MHILTNRLRYFLRCAECGGIKAAARELGLTQAALSISLKKLETELNSRLLYRRPHGVELTPRGQALYRRLKSAESALAFDVERALAQPEHLPLRLGAVMHFGVRHLMPYLSKQRAQLGTLHVVLGRSLTVYEAVRDGRLDFGVISWTELPKHVESRVLAEDPTAYLGLRSRFPGLAKVRSVRELSRFPSVQLPRPQYDFARHFYTGRDSFVADDVAPFIDMIMGGYGVGLAQPSIFTPAQQKRLAYAAVSPKQHLRIYLIHRADVSTRIIALVEQLSVALGQP